MPDWVGTPTAREVAARLGLRAKSPGGRPFVVANMIASLDGRITVDGRAGGLANRADYEMFHALRAAADAVLAGAGTIRAEGYGAMDQLAVVFTRSLAFPPGIGLFQESSNRVLLVTTSDAEVAPCPARIGYMRFRREPIDIDLVLHRLTAEHDIRAAICEGGPHLNATLLENGSLDELHLVTSPLLVGGSDPLTLVTGPSLVPPRQARLLWLLESEHYLFSRYSL
ncbi:MAG: dihydrofolate reductase family protein [Gemmatimonadales bacterium]